jgi:signal peptidase I
MVVTNKKTYNYEFMLIILLVGLVFFLVSILLLVHRNNLLNHKKLSSAFDYILFCFSVLFVLIYTLSFVISLSTVKQDSMKPTLKDNDKVFVLSYIFTKPKVSDIVALYIPEEDEFWVKRIFACEGDLVSYQYGEIVNNTTNTRYPSDQPFQNEDYIFNNVSVNDWDHITKNIDGLVDSFIVPKGYYICFGDNWNFSKDSREYGMFYYDNIKGHILFK